MRHGTAIATATGTNTVSGLQRGAACCYRRICAIGSKILVFRNRLTWTTWGALAFTCVLHCLCVCVCVCFLSSQNFRTGLRIKSRLGGRVRYNITYVRKYHEAKRSVEEFFFFSLRLLQLTGHKVPYTIYIIFMYLRPKPLKKTKCRQRF